RGAHAREEHLAHVDAEDVLRDRPAGRAEDVVHRRAAVGRERGHVERALAEADHGDPLAGQDAQVAHVAVGDHLPLEAIAPLALDPLLHPVKWPTATTTKSKR